MRTAVAELGVPAAIAERIELLDIAERHAGLRRDRGSEADLESAMGERVDGPGRQRRFAPFVFGRATRIIGSTASARLPESATIAAVRPISPASAPCRYALPPPGRRGPRSNGHACEPASRRRLSPEWMSASRDWHDGAAGTAAAVPDANVAIILGRGQWQKECLRGRPFPGRSTRSLRPCGRRGRAPCRRAEREGGWARRSARRRGWPRPCPFRLAGAERASGDEGGGRRPADAGKAMDHDRLAAIPLLDEIEKGRDMRFGGQRMAFVGAAAVPGVRSGSLPTGGGQRPRSGHARSDAVLLRIRVGPVQDSRPDRSRRRVGAAKRGHPSGR